MNNEKFAHRRGEAKVNIPNSANKTVTVKQLKHKFLFGCSEHSLINYVNGEQDETTAAASAKRVEHMAELMNFLTLPFYWGRFEPTEGKPELARMKKTAEFLHERGITTLKGHPLCWHTSCCDWLMEKSNDEIYATQMARIERDIKYFDGLVDMWDVINEAVIMPLFNKYDNAITRLCKDRGRIKLIKDLFREARAANPKATLLINDFETSEAYDILVEGLLEAGVPIDSIGIQSHMHQGYWGVEKTQEILERFSRFNLPIHFTEISLVSGEIMPRHIVDLNDHQVESWPSEPACEERQMNETVELYEMLFAHPLVVGITWWSLMDGLWLKAPSGLLDVNSNPKPVYKALHDRIKGDWWMKEQHFTADTNGNIHVTGYSGDYIAVCGGEETTFTI